jgi:hypothetical protein
MASPYEKLPSLAGRKALINIAAGRSSSRGLSGRSEFGGHLGTMHALKKRGLVTWDDQLTESGKAMVERINVVPEVL